jgi:hypothetical protein
MSSFKTLSLVFLAPLAVACTAPIGVEGGGTAGVGGATSSATSGTTTTAASTSSSSGGPLTCESVDQGVGCCDGSGVLHYCTKTMTVADQACTGGNVCGWDAANGYYDCVPAPGGADPSGTSPIACGGGSSTTSSSSSSTSSSTSSTSSSTTSSSGGTSTTWTEVYGTLFGPSGASSCVKNGGCHTGSQSGFKCGTSSSSCYNGFVSSGWVTPGASASSSPLADPSQSPLCGSLGGNMPKGGGCLSASGLTKLQSWLAAGAANN